MTAAARGSVEIVWHRSDLRLHDNAAVHAAASSHGAVAGLVILDPELLEVTSARRRALFFENVHALRSAYERCGSMLFVRRGRPEEELVRFAADIGASHIHALRSHSPYGRARDESVSAALQASGGTLPASSSDQPRSSRGASLPPRVRLHWHDAVYIHAPGTILTRGQRPFSVYGPFARRWHEVEVGAELDPPARLLAPGDAVPHGQIPNEESDVPLPAPGEDAALDRLDRFIAERIDSYEEQRNRLDGTGSSRLSIDLTLGTLSPRTVFHRAAARHGEGARKLIGELIWRDFLADLLHHRPHLIDEPFDERFARFPWEDDQAVFDAWSRGETGIPVVDAAMRELQATGWISNRARMVAAQFLTKHLRIDWRRGERLFRRLLLDGAVASNVGNWQWAVGLGVDNAPWFRIFNPVSQGREHDPRGTWLSRWVPESFGDPRPLPHAIVDIAEARREYLAVMESLGGRAR